MSRFENTITALIPRTRRHMGPFHAENPSHDALQLLRALASLAELEVQCSDCSSTEEILLAVRHEGLEHTVEIEAGTYLFPPDAMLDVLNELVEPGAIGRRLVSLRETSKVGRSEEAVAFIHADEVECLRLAGVEILD